MAKPKTPEQLAKKKGYCYMQNCPSGSVHIADDRIKCSKCYRSYKEKLEREQNG